jgi:hypothetical protein
MFWLTLLLVWAAASIAVAIVWGKVSCLSEDCGERPDAGSASALDSTTEAPARDDAGRRSTHR